MNTQPTSNNEFFDIDKRLASLPNEAHKFFQELAQIRGETVEETIKKTTEAARGYLEAVETEIEFRNDRPTDMNEYEDKLKKIAKGIEECWLMLSEENRDYFIHLGLAYTKLAINKLYGFNGLKLRLKLVIPSIRQRQNLFKKYIIATTAIPKAVGKVIEIDKETISNLQKRHNQLIAMSQKL